MTAQRAVENIQQQLTTRHLLATRAEARTLETLVHMGETELVQRALDDIDEDVRTTTAMRVVQATLSLAHQDPEGATAALAPILAGASPVENPRWHRGTATESECRRRPRRYRRQLTGAGTCARRSGPARRSATSIAPAPSASAARAPRAAPHHSRLADLRDPEPALRTPSGRPARGRRAARGTTVRERASRAALPADQPPRAGKSRPNYSCRSTRSVHIRETCTPSSACTTAPTRSSERASSACYRPPRSSADPGRHQPRAGSGSGSHRSSSLIDAAYIPAAVSS